MSPIPFTPPHTITTGELVTVSTMNLEWGGNASFLANPPACRVYHNATISIPNATLTALTFNSERYDTDTMHNTVTANSRITFNTAGLYVVSATGEYAANGTGDRRIHIRLNTGNYIAWQVIPAFAGLGSGFACTTVYKFAAGDYVEAFAYQTSGAALNMQQFANYSPEFAATWIGLG